MWLKFAVIVRRGRVWRGFVVRVWCGAMRVCGEVRVCGAGFGKWTGFCYQGLGLRVLR